MVFMLTSRYFRKGDGWAYTIYLPRGANGRYGQIKKQGFPTRDAAKDAMAAMLQTLEAGEPPKRITVAAYLDEWLERGVKERCAPRTLATYADGTRHARRAFGSTYLSDLSPRQIEALYRDLAARFAPSTVHAIHRYLHAALNRAVKWGYLAQSPMARVDTPSLFTPERQTLTADEALRALAWVQERSPAIHIGLHLALFLGLRRSEISGLQWQDIDEDALMIHVRRTRQRSKGREFLGPTKTPQSARSIRADEDTMAMLHGWKTLHKEHHLMRGEPWSEQMFVYRQLHGAPCDGGSMARKIGYAETALGLPHVTLHDLRHTHATLLLEAGVPLKTVSARLGHSSIRITGDVYAHVTARMQDEAVEALKRAFHK